ncbi:MAG TPA: cupredoxin domain-containing protein [bacterium]|nr:cupredoxin domain-containing protein [bacterium]
MRWLSAVALVLAVALIPSAVSPAAEMVRTVSVTAKEFSFTPSRIALKAGGRVALRITNRGTMDHEFVSPGLFAAVEDIAIRASGVNVEADEVEEVELEPGRTVTIEFTVKKTARAQTIQFWCGEKLKGKLHRDLGMRGTITVVR